MITSELISFTKGEIAKGKTQEQIKSELLASGGWSLSDIDEAFLIINSSNTTSVNTSIPRPPTDNRRKKHFIKKNLVKRFFILIFVLGILFLWLKVFADKVVIVTDADTGEPIEGVEVAIEKPTFDAGCIKATIYQTNLKGIAKITNHRFACSIEVSKEGYLLNGKSDHFSLPSRFKISLQKENYKAQLHRTQNLYQDDGVDILNTVTNPVTTGAEKSSSALYSFDFLPVKTIFPNLLSDSNPDFIVEEITKTGKEPSSGANLYKFKLKFMGDGGIQEVKSNLKDVANWSELPYDLFNLTTPPQSDYSKDLIIEPKTIDNYYTEADHMYVLKLRDGKTFVKVIPTVATDQNGKGFLNMMIVTFAEYKPTQQVVKKYYTESPFGRSYGIGYGSSINDKTGGTFVSFAGLVLELPKKFSIKETSSDLADDNTLWFEDELGNKFTFNSKIETYQNFIVRIRETKIIEESPKGFYKIINNVQYPPTPEYTFYDSHEGRSYSIKEDINSELGWNTEDIINFLQLETIQQ